MGTKIDELKEIGTFLNASLLRDGWEIISSGMSIIYRLDYYVVRLENQGHGYLDWVGYEYDDSLFSPGLFSEETGYRGAPPAPLAVFSIAGSRDNCRVDAKTAILEGTIYSGGINGAYNVLVEQTRSQIAKYGSRSGYRA